MKRFTIIQVLALILICAWSGNGLAQASDQPHFRQRLYQLETGYTDQDVEVEIEFGRNLAARILSRYPLVDQPAFQEYLTLLGNGVAAQIGRPELRYYFAMLDTDEVNAYACPGGYIFITRGAIQLMENEAQLAGVIAHEIWHVNYRHVVKPLKIRSKGDSATSGIAAAIGSGTAAFRILLDQLTEKAYQLLFEEGISKESELETDAAAIESLLVLGYDWKSYQQYLSSLEKGSEKKNTEVLSKTHPTAGERLDAMNKLSKRLQITDKTGKKNAKRYQSYASDL